MRCIAALRCYPVGGCRNRSRVVDRYLGDSATEDTGFCDRRGELEDLYCVSPYSARQFNHTPSRWASHEWSFDVVSLGIILASLDMGPDRTYAP
jgi:hypothetical protein